MNISKLNTLYFNLMKNKIHLKFRSGILLFFLFFLFFSLPVKRHLYKTHENTGILLIYSCSPIQESAHPLYSSFIPYLRPDTDKTLSNKYIKSEAQAAYPLQIGMITLFLILIVWLWLRERRHKREMAKTHTELSLALDAGYMGVWRYSVHKQKFTPLYKQTIPQGHMSKEDMRNMLHPKDQSKYDRFFERLLSGEEERSQGIFRLADPSGYKSYEIYAIALKGKNGQVSQIIGTERNITDLMRQQEEYKENRQMLEFTMHAFNTIVWEYQAEKGLLSISNTFSNHFNPYHKNYIPLDDFLRHVHPDDRSLLVENLENLEHGRSNLMMIQIRTKSPQETDYHWFEMNAVTYRYEEDGRPRKIIGLKHDITDIKRTQELIRLRRQAEEANRMKSTFLANMSHDIRTPLNAIVGFSTLLSESDDKQEQREFAAIIQENTDILLHLINDILDITKIEAGRLDFIYSDVNLTDIFHYMEQTYKYRLKEGVRLLCMLPEESFVIHSEKNRLTQVISNFLSNACKYTFQGNITMGYEIYEDHLRLYVSDTGKGIAAENLPRVFDRFAKFDPSVQGTGLGLSICQLIIRTLGGEIGVDSELGKGSTFWFTLPRPKDGL